MNLLSVGAAYGLLVVVFQHGVGSGLLGFEQVDALEAWLSLFLSPPAALVPSPRPSSAGG